MRLLNQENIQLFKNLTEINYGFRIPNEAYIHGKDFSCFEELGCESYFSNFWYGNKEEAIQFAEVLANYFKEEYNKIIPEPNSYDFYGMVVIWYDGNNALVATINLEENLCFAEEGIPKNLKKELKKYSLKHILKDDSENSVSDFPDFLNKKTLNQILPFFTNND